VVKKGGLVTAGKVGIGEVAAQGKEGGDISEEEGGGGRVLSKPGREKKLCRGEGGPGCQAEVAEGEQKNFLLW